MEAHEATSLAAILDEGGVGITTDVREESGTRLAGLEQLRTDGDA